MSSVLSGRVFLTGGVADSDFDRPSGCAPGNVVSKTLYAIVAPKQEAAEADFSLSRRVNDRAQAQEFADSPYPLGQATATNRIPGVAEDRIGSRIVHLLLHGRDGRNPPAQLATDVTVELTQVGKNCPYVGGCLY